MKKRALYWIVPLSLLPALGAVVLFARQKGTVDFDGAVALDRPPSIRPDYTDAVIPPNIAPLNFLVEEPGTRYGVRVRSTEGEVIEIASRTPRIKIPPSRWKRLLGANRGRALYFDVCVRGEDGRWTRFAAIANTVADAEIDRYLFYRLIRPIYILRTNVNIHQRNVETYEESVVVSNRSFKGGCINCHALAPNHPDKMVFQCRGLKELPHLSGMIVASRGEVRKVDTRAHVDAPEHGRGRIPRSLGAYTSWHPNGRLAAFSANKITQFFHAVGEGRDVFDAESDLALYHFDSNTVTTTPDISRPDRLETFPAWSPDGRYLYFCSTDPLPKQRYKEIRYDLMRIAYDPDTDRWGKLESMLTARDTGLSATEPRVSPDGRWLLFCMADYGAFPVFRPSSDLHLMDLETGRHRPLAVNSPRSDSWHSWSRNSRWIAFASKRRDGLFARIYFSHIDREGRAHKPVILPQEDPTFYDRFLNTYNVPELSPWPAPATGRELAHAMRAPLPPGEARPAAGAGMQGPGMEDPGEDHP